MQRPRGLPRLRALFDRWLQRVSVEIDSGCIYISGAVEFDDRPGPGARRAGRRWCRPGRTRSSARSAPPSTRATCAPTPTRGQLLFEIHGLILALHHDARFLRHAGAEDARPRRLRAAARPRRDRRAAGARAARAALPDSSSPRRLPCRHYTPPLRDMQFVMHEVLDVVDELKRLPRARRGRRRHHQRGPRGGRQVRERGARAAQRDRRRRGLHARQGDARGEDARPASRRPTRSTSKAAGRRSAAIRRSAARACRTSSTSACSRC